MRCFYIPHDRVHPDLHGESMTKQSFKDECDIHNILAAYKRTGMIEHIMRHEPRFDDLPDDVDYQSNLNIVMEAQENFARLPARLRAEFGNDPGRFLQALQDPKNAERFIELGLLERPTSTVPSASSSVPSQPPTTQTSSSSLPAPTTSKTTTTSLTPTPPSNTPIPSQ